MTCAICTEYYNCFIQQNGLYNRDYREIERSSMLAFCNMWCFKILRGHATEKDLKGYPINDQE